MGSCQRIDVLRNDLSLPGAVVVDSMNAYYADQPDGGTLVERTPLTGGGFQQLATLSGALAMLAVDGSGLYCLTDGAPGSAIQRLYPAQATTAASPNFAGALALGNGFVWWLGRHLDVPDAGARVTAAADDAGGASDGGAGGAIPSADGAVSAIDAGSNPIDLVRSSESDGGAQVVATVPGPASLFSLLGHALAVGGGDAFIASNDSVIVVRAGSSTPETLAMDTLPVTQLAVDEGFVYWTAETIPPLIQFCIFGSCDEDAAPPPPPPALRRMPRDGGSVVTLASDTLAFPTASGGAIWGSQQGKAGSVLVRIDGSGKRTLLAGGLGNIEGLAVDATNVYWTVQRATGGGMLLRTAR
jgi:hypothetical protein